MKKLSLSLALVLATAGSSFSTIYQLNVELMIGAKWYLGTRSCQKGDGICLSNQLTTNTGLYFDDQARSLWLQIPDSSAIYSGIKDTLLVGADSPIDTALTRRFGTSRTFYISKGAYKVEIKERSKRIYLPYYTR